MLGWLMSLGLAHAGPAFVAEVPEDARLAAMAWRAAEQCAGRPGRAHERVEVVRGAVRGGYVGLALHDDRGLYRIELSAEEARLAEVIVHEVAHAWVNGGPPALTEGRTELLADCIVAKHPGLAPLQWDDGRDLTSLPDLLTWSNRGDHGPAVLADQRTDAYLGSARLLRTAALLVDERALWAHDALDWDGFAALLAHAPEGRMLLDVLHGGATVQREALADADVDGLPTLAERLLGTDPHRWDSDADGWWDGSLLGVPARSLALPIDGTPVCTGFVGASPGAVARVVTGGNLRGGESPHAVLIAGAQRGVDVDVAPGEPVLVALHGPVRDVTGGLWARVRGGGLAFDASCVVTPDVSVWTVDPELAPLVPRVVAHIEAVRARAEERWGPAPRVAVALGGNRTTFEGRVLYLGRDELQRAVARGRLDELSALALTIPHVWRSGVLDWSVGEALARSLFL